MSSRWFDALAFVPDAVVVTDANYLVVFWNGAAEELYKIPAAEAVGQKVDELIEVMGTTISRTEIRSLVQRTGSWRGEAQHKPKGGQAVWVDWSITKCELENNETGYLAIKRNIDQQKRTEQDYKTSEFMYRAVIDHSSDIVICADRNGTFKLVNQVFASTFGKTPDYFVGKSFWDIYPKEHADRRQAANSLVFARGESQSMEAVVPLPDQTRYFIARGDPIKDENGQVVFNLIHATDVTERKQAEERLRDSEESYRILANAGQALIWTAGTDQKCNYFNQPWLEFTGRSLEQELGDGWVEGVHPDDLERCVATYREAFDRREWFSMDYRLRYHNGEYRWIQDAGTPRHDSQGNFLGYIGHCLDITARKLAEDLSKQAQDLSNTLIDAIPGTFYMLDETGKYVRWNAYQRDEIVGKPDEQVASTNALDTIHPDDRLLIQSRIGNVLLSGVEETVEARVLLRGGPAFRWLIMTGRRMFIDTRPFLLGIGIDITDRKLAEERLARSHDLLANLARQVPGVIYQYRLDPDGRSAFPWSSQGMNDIYEVTPEEVRDDATLVFGRLHPEDYDQVAGAIQESARTLNPFFCEFRVMLPRQGLRWRWSQAQPERTADGGTLWHGIISDITDRKVAEAENGRLEGQLQQAMKMEAIGRLAGGVAHDFNNLLTGIMGYIALALMDLKPHDPLAETLLEVDKAANSAAALTRQLLAFSRKQIIEPRVVDLNDILLSLHKMLVRLIGEDIELKTIACKPLGSVNVDPGQVEQILVNLAVNARDAMVDGGKLSIETANIVLDEEYCLSRPYASLGQHVMLAVSDTGHGMTEEVKSHLFEPFFTTKAIGRGTGLGLATIYGAVKQANGFIEVYSELGQGTTFKIYLPCVAGKSEALEKGNHAVEIPGGTETILLVEDEGIVRDLAIKILKRLGYKVLHAPDGGMAFMLAEKYMDRIDLLMTDVVMPGMNGRQLAERLVKIHPETKVLYSSGYTENIIVHHGVIEDNLNFIGKPYTLQPLARKLREVLGKEK